MNVRALPDWDAQAVPHPKARKGTVVNVSSVNGLCVCVLPACSPTTSQGAMDHSPRCTAPRWRPRRPRNCVNPYAMITNLHKRGGMNDSICRVSGTVEGKRIRSAVQVNRKMSRR